MAPTNGIPILAPHHNNTIDRLPNKREYTTYYSKLTGRETT